MALSFTGERLHEGSELFGVDLARHRAAYYFAAERAAGGRVLDMGCGSGYGAAELAQTAPGLIGLDRVPPDSHVRDAPVHFVTGDLNGIPLSPGCFDLVVSFQVIEHLEDPTLYLTAMARMLKPEGLAIITTPNLMMSDRENPYHVHEYLADELQTCLEKHFFDVEMRGVGQTTPVAHYHKARLQRIRRITRLDPLRLRNRIPRNLVEWLFARFALVVRRGIQRSDGLPDVTFRDFPIGAADDDCLDLLALCRSPKAKSA